MKIYQKLQLSMDLHNTKIGTAIFFGVGLIALSWSFLRNQCPKNDEISYSQIVKQMKQMRYILEGKKMTIEECKKVLWLIFKFTMIKLEEHNKLLKKRRGSSKTMEEYLETLILGVEQAKTTVAKAKVEAYHRLGITNSVFIEFQAEIASFKKQFKKQYLNENKSKELGYAEIQHFLQLQIQYFQREGQQLANEIIQATYCWPKDKKSCLRHVIPLIIIDKSLKDYPQIDETQFESAKRKYRQQLSEELYKLGNASQNFTDIIRHYLHQ